MGAPKTFQAQHRDPRPLSLCQREPQGRMQVRSRARTPNLAPPALPNPLLSVLPTASPGPGQPASPSSPQLCLSPGTGLCLLSKRKPEETNQGAPRSLPTPPAPASARTRSCSGRTFPTGHLEVELCSCQDAAPPPPNHSLPIKTLILFLILRWEGWDEGSGGVGPSLTPLPGPPPAV